MSENDSKLPPAGMLAKIAGEVFPVEVCKSAAGYYIGTRDAEGMPFTRESEEYWGKPDQAATALKKGRWTQRLNF
jgi:hypothetical protein